MSQDIPNFLVRTPGRLYHPYSGWRTYKNKEIVFSSKERIIRWDVHPRGIIAEIGLSLFVDGKNIYKIEEEKKREEEEEEIRYEEKSTTFSCG